jgi:CSLREA domain-containing protein
MSFRMVRRAIFTFLLMLASLVVPLASSSQAATITVTTRNDELEDDGDCSLREAVVTVNTGEARDDCAAPDDAGNKIVLKGLTYNLSMEGRLEGEGLLGDLDITAPNTQVVGRGMNATTVDANDIDRVFESHVGSRFAHLTITGGEVAQEEGGGIFVDGSPNVLDHVRVVDNEVTATEETYTGGGIASYGALQIRDSDISQNQAPRGGGIFHARGGNPIEGTLGIKRSAIHHNTATHVNGGPGLEVQEDTIVDNTTIAENDGVTEGDRGGILVDGSGTTLDMSFTTIAGNSPRNLYITGDVTAEASIIADSENGDNCEIDAEGSMTALGINIDEDGTCNGSIQQDPKLQPLGEYGGPVPTMALMSTSPARNTAFEVCIGVDARGVPRPRAGCDSGANTNAQDLGAYEFVRCSGTVVNVVGTSKADKLMGSIGPDGVLALAGNDTVLANDGNDKVCGGDGKDLLKGQGDKDKLLGEAGNDRLRGGPARDTCIGGPGNDSATECEVKKSL